MTRVFIRLLIGDAVHRINVDHIVTYFPHEGKTRLVLSCGYISGALQRDTEDYGMGYAYDCPDTPDKVDEQIASAIRFATERQYAVQKQVNNATHIG